MINEFFHGDKRRAIQYALNLGHVTQLLVTQSDIIASVSGFVNQRWIQEHWESDIVMIQKPAIEVEYPDGTKRFIPWDSKDGAFPVVGTVFEIGKTITLRWPHLIVTNPH